jgi:iron complex outermembrane receptor protein
MKKYFIVLIFIPFLVKSQNTFKAIIFNQKTKEALPNAAVLINKYKIATRSDSAGQVTINNLPNGELAISFSYIGYKKKIIDLVLPVKESNNFWEVALEKDSTEELEQVIVTTTRSSRNIETIPTRIEAIVKEELDEKSSMKPGDIRMLLNESTGITTQQTSAVSGTANLRIQGLDGRYTQILKDGMPLYNGFSGGLSIMQIPPLDLKQVEFIKGSASTLYGGGAIAGLVNLISKTPKEKEELSVLLNGTSAKGFDASGFYAKKFNKVGTTVFAAYNYNAPYDPSSAGLTAIPKINRITINPKIFFYPDNKTTGFFGINITQETRYGGDLKVLDGNADSLHQYFEKNISSRLSSQFNIERKLGKGNKIQFKNAVGYYNRTITQPNTGFHGEQVSSFSELNYSLIQKKTEWVAGLNLWTDGLHALDTSKMNYTLSTVGAFAQNVYKPVAWFTLETGVRLDVNSPATKDKPNGFFLLPRMNMLFQLKKNWSSRIGGGLGYKMPSPFNEEAEEKGYQNILPINSSSTNAEESYGLHADVTYKIKTAGFLFSFNQLFFYTNINHPLILQGNSLVNANGFLDTKGLETNIRIGIDELNFYIGYTLADVNQHFNNSVSTAPLAAKHRLNFDVTYEAEKNYRIGFEAFYTSSQLLNDGSVGKGYVVMGLLFEKMWKNISFFLNAENFTDRRQTRWGSIYTGTITNPSFRDIYAPLDGAVVNSGVKLKLL